MKSGKGIRYAYVIKNDHVYSFTEIENLKHSKITYINVHVLDKLNWKWNFIRQIELHKVYRRTRGLPKLSTVIGWAFLFGMYLPNIISITRYNTIFAAYLRKIFNGDIEDETLKPPGWYKYGYGNDPYKGEKPKRKSRSKKTIGSA